MNILSQDERRRESSRVLDAQPVSFISASGTTYRFASLRDAGRFLRSVGIIDPSTL